MGLFKMDNQNCLLISRLMPAGMTPTCHDLIPSIFRPPPPPACCDLGPPPLPPGISGTKARGTSRRAAVHPQPGGRRAARLVDPADGAQRCGAQGRSVSWL